MKINPRFNGQGISFLTREQMEKIHSCTLQLMQERSYHSLYLLN